MGNAFRLVALSLITVVNGAGALAQSPTVSCAGDVKQLTPMLGRWVYREEFRRKPDAAWEIGASEWENRWLGEGCFLDSPGSITFPTGQRVRVVQVYGYDPVRKLRFIYYFASEGTVGTGVWEWSGATGKQEIAEVAADGTTVSLRCASTFSADAYSMEGACERLTDGNWWVFRRFKGTKQ